MGRAGSLEIAQVFEPLPDGLYFLSGELFFVLALGYKIPQNVDDKFVDTAESAAFDDSLDLLIKRAGNFQSNAIFSHLPNFKYDVP